MSATTQAVPQHDNKRSSKMTQDELKQVAVDYLAKAFDNPDSPAHLVQAAVAIVLTLKT
jgi:hypothetical protein